VTSIARGAAPREGTVSIVTGAASGIGRATAAALAGRGAALVLVDRASEGVDVAASMATPSSAVKLDPSELDRLAGVVEQPSIASVGSITRSTA
jgi:NAD(P)-dependent dehydrogenase (short-subunit alcohol dehydrogenase family)